MSDKKKSNTPSKDPNILYAAIDALYKFFMNPSHPERLQQEGVFRLSGLQTKIDDILAKYNTSQAIEQAVGEDVNVMTGVLKTLVKSTNGGWELKFNLSDTQKALCKGSLEKNDDVERAKIINELLKDLKEQNPEIYLNIGKLCIVANAVIVQKEVNKMTAKNVSIAFQSLADLLGIQANYSNFTQAEIDNKKIAAIIQQLFTHFSQAEVFKEVIELIEKDNLKRAQVVTQEPEKEKEPEKRTLLSRVSGVLSRKNSVQDFGNTSSQKSLQPMQITASLPISTEPLAIIQAVRKLYDNVELKITHAIAIHVSAR